MSTSGPGGSVAGDPASRDSGVRTMQRTHGRPLVTPAFHPLADFADFGDTEAQMLRDCTSRRLPHTQAVASAVVDELSPRLAAAGVGGGMSREAVATWLAQSSTGPFDAGFADFLRPPPPIAGGATFPGVTVPIPGPMNLR